MYEGSLPIPDIVSLLNLVIPIDLKDISIVVLISSSLISNFLDWIMSPQWYIEVLRPSSSECDYLEIKLLNMYLVKKILYQIRVAL